MANAKATRTHTKRPKKEEFDSGRQRAHSRGRGFKLMSYLVTWLEVGALVRASSWSLDPSMVQSQF